MKLQSLDATVLSIPFNSSFKHASAVRAATQTLWVQAHGTNNICGYGEGCPREYVTDESLESAQAFVVMHCADWLANIHDIGSLINWVTHHRSDIDTHPAAWAAVELALLDLFGKEQECSVENLLGLSEIEGRFSYSAVLGDAAVRQFEAQLARYIQTGFGNFKIKLSGNSESDLGKIAALVNAGIAPYKVRADANNLWHNADTAIAYLRALNYEFFAIEEPLQTGDIAGMQRISNTLNTKIILDESLLRIEQLDGFCECPEQWIINLRISKMGGLLRSLDLARAANKRGIRLIVGAHVGETSLLTRAALTVVRNTQNIVLAQEGAFGTHLLAYDVVQSPLMFGANGVLDTDAFNFATQRGWGLAISSQTTV
ncbi:MAG: mandelate racemase/muconate lactonizing enzyme family protein [Burkholderiaceae bacterium]